MEKEKTQTKDKKHTKEKEKMQGKEKSQKKTEDLLIEKDKQIADYEKRMEKMRFDSMLDGELSGSKAKNKVAVKALLDLEKISVEDGKMVGAQEQINAIKANDGYLFESATTGGGANPSHVKEAVDMDSLTDKEYFKMKFRE